MKKHRKTKYRTSWISLSFVVLISSLFSLFVVVSLSQINYEIPIQDISALIEIREREQKRQDFLKKLRYCESRNKDTAVGDSGASIGPYQWQKPTLEDYLGYKVSFEKYYSIVTDYEKIHEITYETIFEKGEMWRWKICSNKHKHLLK